MEKLLQESPGCQGHRIKPKITESPPSRSVPVSGDDIVMSVSVDWFTVSGAIRKLPSTIAKPEIMVGPVNCVLPSRTTLSAKG